MSEWNEILKKYEILGVESVIPIAHIRIRPDVRSFDRCIWKFHWSNSNEERKVLHPVYDQFRK